MPPASFAISPPARVLDHAMAASSALLDPGSPRFTEPSSRTLEKARGNLVRAADQCVKNPTLLCFLDAPRPGMAELRGEIALLLRSSKGGHGHALTAKEHFEASQRLEISDSVGITRVFPRNDPDARGIAEINPVAESITPTSRSGATRKKISPLQVNF